jgi:hypothetical protein
MIIVFWLFLYQYHLLVAGIGPFVQSLVPALNVVSVNAFATYLNVLNISNDVSLLSE